MGCGAFSGNPEFSTTDAIQETGDAIQRNPLAAISIAFGVGFLFGLAMGGRR